MAGAAATSLLGYRTLSGQMAPASAASVANLRTESSGDVRARRTARRARPEWATEMQKRPVSPLADRLQTSGAKNRSGTGNRCCQSPRVRFCISFSLTGGRCFSGTLFLLCPMPRPSESGATGSPFPPSGNWRPARTTPQRCSVRSAFSFPTANPSNFGSSVPAGSSDASAARPPYP